MELGKRIKKLLGQDLTLAQIIKMLQKSGEYTHLSPRRCIREYNKYVGVQPKINTGDDLLSLIKYRENILVWGETGVGKSYAVRRCAEILDRRIIVSHARNESELVSDFADLPRTEKDYVCVLEGDNYYWRKYGLIRKMITNSVCAFVVIVTEKDTPTKHVRKHLEKVKILPPTRSDVAEFFSKYDNTTYTPHCDFITQIYSKDWRKIWQKYTHGVSSIEYKPEHQEEISSKKLAYKIIRGKAHFYDFYRCYHPLIFILKWIAYNLHIAQSGDVLRKNLELISWIDQHKYSYKQKYLHNALLDNFIPTRRRIYLKFPPYQKKKKEEKEDTYEVTKVDGKSTTTSSNKKEKNQKDIRDFLLI